MCDRRRYRVWEGDLIGPSYTTEHEGYLPVYQESAVRELVEALQSSTRLLEAAEKVLLIKVPLTEASGLASLITGQQAGANQQLLAHYKDLR